MSRNLLVITNRPDDLAFATEVARVAELSLVTASEPKRGAEIIAADSPPVIFVDTSDEKMYQAFESEIQETIGLFSDRISQSSIHFISSNDLDEVPYLIQSPLFSNFINRHYGDPAEAGLLYGRIIKALLSKRAFGLTQMLGPSAKVQVIKIGVSSQKQDAVEAVRNFMIAGRFQTRMATVVANAVDEILMNSIFDAPVDDAGRPLYKLTNRASTFKLDGKQEVEMHVGFDGKYIAVTSADHYGSLDKASLLSHIAKIYTQDEYKVRASVASAGIGLATVYRSGGSLLFVSESRVRTEATVFFKKTDSFKNFKEQFRFLSTQFYF